MHFILPILSFHSFDVQLFSFVAVASTHVFFQATFPFYATPGQLDPSNLIFSRTLCLAVPLIFFSVFNFHVRFAPFLVAASKSFLS